MSGYDFLDKTHSKPLTLGDLEIGDLFIVFPDDGDDAGHGGFRDGGTLLRKIKPVSPGKAWHKDTKYTCCEMWRGGDGKLAPGHRNTLPLTVPVIKVHIHKAK